MTVEGYKLILATIKTWREDLSTPPLSSCVTPNPEQDIESVPYLCIWLNTAPLTACGES